MEDEKPLWAATDPSGRVTAFGDAASRKDAVTCGLYALTAGAEIEQLNVEDYHSTAAINLTGNEFANTIFSYAVVSTAMSWLTKSRVMSPSS